MKNHFFTRKRILLVGLILFISVAFLIYSAIIFRTLNPSKSLNIWKTVAIDECDIYILQEGKYSGGNSEISNKGYVFSSYNNTPEEVMNKMGFYNIGHIYTDNNKTQNEYCTDEIGLHTIIEGRLFYLGGYLLKYRVVGVA